MRYAHIYIHEYLYIYIERGGYASIYIHTYVYIYARFISAEYIYIYIYIRGEYIISNLDILEHTCRWCDVPVAGPTLDVGSEAMIERVQEGINSKGPRRHR